MAYISIRSIASFPSCPVFNPLYTFHPQEFWGHSQTERGYNKSLVLWVYRNHCYLVEGNDFVQQSPEMCNLQVLSVWDQEVQTVMFKITKQQTVCLHGFAKKNAWPRDGEFLWDFLLANWILLITPVVQDVNIMILLKGIGMELFFATGMLEIVWGCGVIRCPSGNVLIGQQSFSGKKQSYCFGGEKRNWKGYQEKLEKEDCCNECCAIPIRKAIFSALCLWTFLYLLS